MKCAYVGIILLLQLIGNEQVYGQRDLFSIGGIVGVNFSLLPFEEISNDEKTNNHNGLNAGIYCNADINEHFNLKIEILYSGNGDYLLPETFPRIEYAKINLNHVEIPFHFDFYVNSFEVFDFLPDMAIEFGGAYARLFRYYAEDIEGNDVSDQILYHGKDTFLMQIGTTIYFAKRFGGNIRFSMPINHRRSELGLTTTLRIAYNISGRVI